MNGNTSTSPGEYFDNLIRNSIDECREYSAVIEGMPGYRAGKHIIFYISGRAIKWKY